MFPLSFKKKQKMMEDFEIAVGETQRRLKVQAQGGNTYQIYAVDPAEDWLNYQQARSVDTPADGVLGTITVKGEKDFEFNGIGAFTGQDLQSMAAQIVRHPSFNGAQ
ncbi:hypothetical protein GCM10027037_32060 [Mucilaginibacter koreensis]